MQPLGQVRRKGEGWKAAGALALVYLVAVWLVPPAGEFPLNDDWSYAAATRHFLETGRIKFQPWTSASLLLQLLWGAAACRISGFSFEVLRTTTLVAAWLGSLGCYFLFRLWVKECMVAFLCALVIVTNPLYLNLSYTFMTDVPFTAFLAWAAFYYSRGLKEERASDLFRGGLCSCGALLVRPYGIVVAGAAALVAIVRFTSPRRRAAAAAALGLPVVTLLAYHAWLALGPGLPAGYQARLATFSLAAMPVAALDYGFRAIEYLGLFLLPLLLAGRWRPGGNTVRVGTLSLVLLAAGVGIVYWRQQALMFYLTNVLYDLGAGALTLRDTLFLNLAAPWRLGLALSLPLTAAATIGGALLIGRLAPSHLNEEVAAQFLLLATGAFFVLFFCLGRYFFDRHLLVLFPFVSAALAARSRGFRPWVLGLFVAVIGGFSLAATHDYLAWNTARWKGIEAVMADEGVGPQAIDGGFEFNAWFLAEQLGTVPGDDDVRPVNPGKRKSWWWVVDDQFVASFRPLPGYVVRRVERFRRLVPWGRGEVFILQRSGSGSRGGGARASGG